MTVAAIIAQDLIKDYSRTRALDRVSLTINRGEWVSIMGPSGSGKTTLLNIIGCLDKPTAGQVLIEGADISQFNKSQLTQFRREVVGLIFQQFHLIPYLTTLENVMLAQYFHSLVAEDEAKEALERVGLGDRLNHLPSQLSGGEQQRVCIARALINHPRLLLADEPTGNLDQANEEMVMALLQQEHQKGHTMVMVTHDPQIAQEADRVIRLDHGHLVA